MKKIILFVFLAYNSNAQVLTVWKNDPRLKIYIDSMECYNNGLYEIKMCKLVKNKKDYAANLPIADELNKRMAAQNPSIRWIAEYNELGFAYRNKGAYETWCIPTIYKKPQIKIIFVPIAKMKSIKPRLITEATQEIKKATSIKIKAHEGDVMMPNGTKISKQEFKERYSKKVYTKL